MGSVIVAASNLLAFASGVFGQSDRGTIEGTVSDSARAVVAKAPYIPKAPGDSTDRLFERVKGE
jgi:hypothetical protein